ncbi:MAG: RHS repeat-associated core domain-containing protein [Deltaproteobacteria bacterium]
MYATLDGQTCHEDFIQCIGGMSVLTSGQSTFACFFHASYLGVGTHMKFVSLQLSDGSWISDSLVWHVVQGGGCQPTPELCDGVDNDCNGVVDDGPPPDAMTWYPDVDGDGFGDVSGAVSACAAPAGYTDVVGDCDDAVPSINPAAVEICDNVDNDCSNGIDDGVLNCVGGQPVPADPSPFATARGGSAVQPLGEGVQFLYSGPDAVQIGATPGAIDPAQAAVLRGRVQLADGSPAPLVSVTVVGQPEYGSTLSRIDGQYDLVVNGGRDIVLDFTAPGYLPVQRRIRTSRQEYALPPDVVMTALDPIVTPIDLSSTQPFQVAQGSQVVDADGARRGTILFPQGLSATMVMPDGSTQGLSSMNVRVTEYTVGDLGQAAMPGNLPATSAYTYAVELSVDEAMAAGATSVDFSQPIPYYVDNFLSIPTGESVPLGYYDRIRSMWVGSPSGLVIDVLSVAGGVAQLDIDGSGVAADSVSLGALGISTDELTTIASLFAAGSSFWRVPIPHFTPFDCNWPYNLPLGAVVPSPRVAAAALRRIACSSVENGDGTQLENQVLGEELDVTGTPFKLHYASDRAPGFDVHRIVPVELYEGAPPPNVDRVDVELRIAGRSIRTSSPPVPDASVTLTWDGVDAYGRTIQGLFPGRVRVGHVYTPVYAGEGVGFGSFAASLIGFNPLRFELLVWDEREVELGGFDARSIGLAGWSLSHHHVYDPISRTLYRGDGKIQNGEEVPFIVRRHANTPLTGLVLIYGFAIDSLGRLYFSNNSVNVSRIGLSGQIERVAGNGTIGFSGDGGPADQAQLSVPRGIAIDRNDMLYIADSRNNRIRRVDLSTGIISTFAGNGVGAFAGDGGPALSASIRNPIGLAIDSQDALYVSTGIFSRRVRRIRPDGDIETYAGSGSQWFLGFTGDGQLATAGRLCAPEGIAFDQNDNLYIADAGCASIRRVRPDGIIEMVVRNEIRQGTGVVAVDDHGVLYFSDGNQIQRMNLIGRPEVVAGDFFTGLTGDGGPATAARFQSIRAMHIDDGRNIFVATGINGQVIRRLTPPFPGYDSQGIFVASAAGDELYQFDPSGRHLATIHPLTGSSLLSFAYDPSGRLASVTDSVGNVTTISRAGGMVDIDAPPGLRTSLVEDSNGFLSSFMNPDGDVTTMAHSSSGLLSSMTKPQGGTTQYTYDAAGRLLGETDETGVTLGLSRVETSTSMSVARTTGLGRQTSYRVLQDDASSRIREVVHPNGTRSVGVGYSSGERTLTLPTGTVIERATSSDPRFGMVAPVHTMRTVTQPSGLANNELVSRTTTLQDPSDLLSVTSVVDTVDRNGRVYTMTFDGAARSLTTVTPAGRSSTRVLDSLGRIVSMISPGFQSVDVNYDTFGRPTRITRGSGATARQYDIVYDSSGFVQSVTDPGGNTAAFSRDGAGRVLVLTMPDGRTSSMTYDGDGNISSVVSPSGAAHSFAYDGSGREVGYSPAAVGGPATSVLTQYDADGMLARVVRQDGVRVDFLRNAVSGRIDRVSVPVGDFVYAYDPVSGLLSGAVSPYNVAIARTYDGFLHTDSLWSGSVSGLVSRTYDADFSVSSESVNGAAVARTYDADKLLTGVGSLTISRDAVTGGVTGTSLGLVATSRAENGFGEVQSETFLFNGSPFFSMTYASRDALGRLTARTEDILGATSTDEYFYDSSARLSEVWRNGALVRSYTYDVNGNRAGTVVDARDRLMQDATYSYVYDEHGELISRTDLLSGAVTSFERDALGNLLAVHLPDATTIEYLVDAHDRRVARLVGGIFDVGWLYDGRRSLIASIDVNGNVISRFVYGEDVNSPEYMVQGTSTYRLVKDHLGSVRLVVDVATGIVAQRLDYDEFGVVLTDTQPGFQPFGFAGGLYDASTGLVRFGARDYDAHSGRWISRDPIRFRGRDFNLYRYAGGDPVNYTDPSGLVCGSGVTDCWVPDYPFGFDFTKACEAHDACYGTLGASRVGCDLRMFADVVTTACLEQSPADMAGCVATAQAYFGAVRLFGALPFRWAQEEAEERQRCGAPEHESDQEPCGIDRYWTPSQ